MNLGELKYKLTEIKNLFSDIDFDELDKDEPALSASDELDDIISEIQEAELGVKYTLSIIDNLL